MFPFLQWNYTKKLFLMQIILKLRFARINLLDNSLALNIMYLEKIMFCITKLNIIKVFIAGLNFVLILCIFYLYSRTSIKVWRK